MFDYDSYRENNSSTRDESKSYSLFENQDIKEQGKRKKQNIVILLDDEEKEKEEYKKLLSLYENSFKEVNEGEIVEGTILEINDRYAIVDVGFKSEGMVKIDEFEDILPELPKPGDKIEVLLEKIEDADGVMTLSFRKASFVKAWSKLLEAHEKGDIVTGKVTKRIRGGLSINLFGVECFLPGSQVDIRPFRNLEDWINQEIAVKIIKLNKRRKNVVVSRRVILEEEREKQRQKILNEIEKGQTREGIVKNVTDFGAFVDLGGVDGLIHITDMSWGRINHPEELIKIGDKIKVMVLDYSENKDRISLGMKQLTPHPWDNIDEKYHINDIVKGKVVGLTDYGAFVEVESGVDGLIHISELSWTNVPRHPSQFLRVGQEIKTKIIDINKEEQKLSLSLRALTPNPWDNIEQKYPVGSKTYGIVRSLTNFGVFVELEEGIEGLIHISDLSWTKRIRHPSEVLRKNERVEVVILGFDRDRKRISLGLKQLSVDPWEELAQKLAVGTYTKGKLTKVLEKGVIVEIDNMNVEGFVPLSQLGKENLEKPSDIFSEGDEIPLRVIEFDEENRRIVLSVKSYFEGKEEDEIKSYIDAHKTFKLTLEDIIGEERAKMIREKFKNNSQNP